MNFQTQVLRFEIMTKLSDALKDEIVDKVETMNGTDLVVVVGKVANDVIVDVGVSKPRTAGDLDLQGHEQPAPFYYVEHLRQLI
jgi:hypothetical protein